MKKKNLVLNAYECETLERYGVVEITRNGFDITVKHDNGIIKIKVHNPYDKINVIGEIKGDF